MKNFIYIFLITIIRKINTIKNMLNIPFLKSNHHTQNTFLFLHFKI